MRRRARGAIVIAAAVPLAAAVAGCSASRPDARPVITTSVPGAASPGTETPGTETPAPDTSGTAVTPSPAATTTIATGAATEPDLSTPPVTTTAPPPAETVGTASATTFPGEAPASTLAPISDSQWAAVDAYLQDRLLGNGDFAYSLAVNIDGEAAHRSAGGVRNSPDMEVPPPATDPPATGDAQTTTVATTTTTTVPGPPPEPVDVTDRFRVASISKVITGTVVLQLVADGQLQLDQAVGAALGNRLGVDVAGRPVEQVTVHQLLSHTAGFGVFDRTFFRGGASSCDEAGRIGLSEGIENQPGTTYRYSNMNFCLLGILIEIVTGQPYEQAVHDRLLDPLGLSGMRLAGTFDPRPDEVVHPSFPGRVYMEALGPAGAWVATAADIVTIVDSLDNTKPGFHPLPDELTTLMRRQVPGIVYRDPYSQWYGLATIAYANQSWGHTGTVENTHSMVVHRPDGMTWALLVSGNYPEESSDLAAILQDAIDQAGIAAPAPTTSTTTTTTTTTTTLAPTTTVAPVAGETTTSTTSP
ncbi:serine hydrolase domain-containing protein [Desertimonas flava]|uniref:serine hydrolase domain-containing protein n=1 Tax=Desertimonas flava TaxID=2064846 RepID=UPI0013C4F977|nr:serine hydrolase domain-containing protein [Desertimonas flava]